ncbi:uncharacterized mitochondrial protein AtMg00810-like [Miscanthus floridulus]|uniref:uncharacterized mitochondrial protein AtMg00810-like n=1 Tax=Miscanthus floridulus TaxID=154761 RepID=UPI00345823CD
MWVMVLGSKGEAADVIRRSQAAAEAECGRKLRVLRTDNGGEFIVAEFASYYADEGIQRHYSASYNPQQNGVVERRNQTDDSEITLRQTTYAKHVVELAGLTDCNPGLTPMEERLKLSRDSTTEEVDTTQYRRLVGSLRYLAHTRPDLAFSVSYVSRFMQRQTTEHQQAVKRIIRYVAGTLDHGLYYPRCPGATHFVGYSDSDHAGDSDTTVLLVAA